MKKYFVVAMFTLFSMVGFSAAPTYHIGIVTTTVSQGEDTLRSAEYLTKVYGSSAKGGIITHVSFPDNFMQETETSISQISALANDPKMKAIIIGEGLPGTLEGIRKVREKRPDILLIVDIP
ncbi:MAG: DUF3798 domain-containing protein, partial [Fusobacteriaceae bacterium]